jgi:hypothetical protein
MVTVHNNENNTNEGVMVFVNTSKVNRYEFNIYQVSLEMLNYIVIKQTSVQLTQHNSINEIIESAIKDFYEESSLMIIGSI